MLSLKNIIREILLDLLSLFGNLFFLLAKKPKIEPEKIKKILIVKLYALGDCVYAQPMVPNLRFAFPNAKIIWLVGKYSRTVVEHIEGVDQIIEWQGAAIYKRLKKENIDLAFSLYRSPLSHLFLWRAGIPIRVGFAWRGRGFSLTHKIKFHGEILESDRYLKLIENLGLPINTRDRTLVANKKESKVVKDKMIKLGIDFNHRPLVGIFAGGGDNPQLLMPQKRWATDRFAQIAEYLVQKKKAQVVILGSPSEQEIADEVGKQSKSKLINIAGKTELGDLVAILSLFDLIIAIDTGPLHIAAALGVPTIGLFGPSDPKILAQTGPKNIVIRKDPNPPTYIPSRVFYRNYVGKSNDPVNPSMLEIKFQDVIEAIEKIL